MIAAHNIHAAVMAQLAPLSPLDHPARSWPHDAMGVIPGVAVELLPDVDGYRLSGRRSHGVARVRLHCVGKDALECLHVVERARTLMDGFRVRPAAGTAREDQFAADPTVNPDADPQRVEVPLTYLLPL